MACGEPGVRRNGLRILYVIKPYSNTVKLHIVNEIKKGLVLGIMFILCSVRLNAGNEFLLVTQKNGQQTCFALIDQPKIECLSGYLTITSLNNTISVPLDDIINFEFANEIPSGIITLRYNNHDVKVNSGHVVISSLPSKSTVNIYSINGTILSTMTSSDDGRLEFDLPKSNGPIIIKTQSRSIKITNK